MIPPANNKEFRLKELDALRGVAALSVVLYHYTTRFNELFSYRPISFFDFPLGKYGVQLFFIVSGFVIFMTLQKTKHPLDFIVNRFARLFPVYWVAVIATFLAVTVFSLPKLETTLGDALINLTMLQYFLSVPDVDGAYWSLAFELVFYFLIFLLFLAKKTGKIEVVGYIWLEMMALYYVLPLSHRWLLGTFFLLRYANLFFAGILFYRIKTNGDSLLRFMGLAACLAVQFLIAPVEEGIIVLGCFIIFYLVIKNKLTIINRRVLLFLGAISYPLYLMHEYLGYIFIRSLYTIEKNPFILFVLSIGFAVLVASLVHYIIEEPTRHAIRKWGSRLFATEKSGRIKKI